MNSRLNNCERSSQRGLSVSAASNTIGTGSKNCRASSACRLNRNCRRAGSLIRERASHRGLSIYALRRKFVSTWFREQTRRRNPLLAGEVGGPQPERQFHDPISVALVVAFPELRSINRIDGPGIQPDVGPAVLASGDRRSNLDRAMNPKIPPRVRRGEPVPCNDSWNGS